MFGEESLHLLVIGERLDHAVVDEACIGIKIVSCGKEFVPGGIKALVLHSGQFDRQREQGMIKLIGFVERTYQRIAGVDI